MKTTDFSKHSKYNSVNPISRLLVSKFLKEIGTLCAKVDKVSVLDCGCGEGVVLKFLEDELSGANCYAFDLDLKEVKDAKKNLPFCTIKVGNLYALPYEDDRFEMVLCTEVLEHLEKPEIALEEIHRVTKRYAIFSVPREPLWRILNMVRFKYCNAFGNTPGHLNHWSTDAFAIFLRSRFNLLDKATPLPWSIFLCEKN